MRAFHQMGVDWAFTRFRGPVIPPGRNRETGSIVERWENLQARLFHLGCLGEELEYFADGRRRGAWLTAPAKS